MSAMVYTAQCHCGALSARYRTSVAPAAWPVRACQCTFCRSHGALSTSDPHGSLEFQSRDPTRVQRYRFGSRTADFLICQECGVYVGVQMTIDRERFGVLNVLSLTPQLAGLPLPEPMVYDAETSELRLSRRAARWTPILADSL
jgi:hypothetical protein